MPAELEAKKGQLEYVVLQNDGDPDRTGEQHPPLPACAEAAGCCRGERARLRQGGDLLDVY